MVKGFEEGNQFQTLLGVTGSGKTFTMANVIQKLQRPTLIIAHNKTLAAQLYSEFKEFFPENAVEYFVSYYDYYQPEAYVPSTDTYIEKDSAINDEIDKLRHSATAALSERKDVIIVASVSCIYGLGSPIDYQEMVISLRPGMIKDRDEVIHKLIDIQYDRNDMDFRRGTFRVRGDVVEIFPAYSGSEAFRVEFFGDEVERITEIDTLTGEIKAELGLPVQSHLSENLSEIDWVKGLCPWSTCYGQTYEHFGLLGNARTIMAHCNYSTNEEIEILKKTGTYVAHCPQSNTFLSSGIAPIRRYLQEGMNVGLGTDVAGEASINMFRAVADAVACSKLRWRCVDQNLAPLTIQEAFYLATIGGGSFFGKVGSFAKGFDFDALVLDDSGIRSPRELNIAQRLERFCYLADEGGKLTAKYVAGRQIQL